MRSQPSRGEARVLSLQSDEALPFGTLSLDDKQSLDQCFRNHSRYVATLAYRLLGQDCDVDDVVQDVFMLVARYRRQLRDPTSFQPWLRMITIRCIFKRMRARKRRDRVLGLYSLVAGRKIDNVSTHEVRSEIEQLRQALERLNADERIVWQLRYIEEESLEEVARLVGCSLATAKRRLTRASETLQKMVDHV